MSAMTDEQRLEPLGALLRRIGGELMALSDITERMQDITEELALRSDKKHIHTLQELDWLHQHLIEIADLLAVMSESTREDWRLDPVALTGRVRIARLTDSLNGRAVVPGVRAETDEDGFELF